MDISKFSKTEIIQFTMWVASLGKLLLGMVGSEYLDILGLEIKQFDDEYKKMRDWLKGVARSK